MSAEVWEVWSKQYVFFAPGHWNTGPIAILIEDVRPGRHTEPSTRSLMKAYKIDRNGKRDRPTCAEISSIIGAKPVVCLDEGGKELRDTPNGTLDMQAGQPVRQDYEYERLGKANLFMSVEPLAGKRRVRVTERHTGKDFAAELKNVVDNDYPDAQSVVVVCDNLATHGPACLYATFAPEEARLIAAKIESPFTPEHGSWLNMAECELSVLARQCLKRRIKDIATLTQEAACWEQTRNARQVKIDWQFTTTDARIKLKRLYPILQELPMPTSCATAEW